jgi:7-cyano-7-deazaguanine synthase
MCSIFGAIVTKAFGHQFVLAENIIDGIIQRSHERGRDGRGMATFQRGVTGSIKEVTRADEWDLREYLLFNDKVDERGGFATLIGNTRAEPTTEFVKEKRKEDQQPYLLGKWAVVHNGTIANDHTLRQHAGPDGRYPSDIDSAAIVEELCKRNLAGANLHEVSHTFTTTISALKGSYAILAMHQDFPGVVFAACNYRPIWYAEHNVATYFASSRDYFPEPLVPQMLPPYSAWMFNHAGKTQLTGQEAPAPIEHQAYPRALVVCSGGLDSVVAATKMLHDGYSVELAHFKYGSRAEGPEWQAISDVADHLGVKVNYLPMAIYDKEDSPLLRSDSAIAGGEAGAEFAHEWVPARNLVMLALATAYAEAKGFSYIVLGNNLEEAGAYPDNEPEFINRFNDLLPFAVGDGKRVRVMMPVGNMMKHEIVKLGHEINAPLHLTWSCYRAGAEHCGTCGPCYMRRKAFAINGLDEVITYKEG